MICDKTMKYAFAPAFGGLTVLFNNAITVPGTDTQTLWAIEDVHRFTAK
jgi:hypothetical protein